MDYNDLIPEFMVSDIEQSRSFYVDLLGFDVVYERPEEKFIFLQLAGIQLMLEEATEENLRTLTYPFGRGANYSLGVSSVEAVYNRLFKAGYPIEQDLDVREFRVGDDTVLSKEFSVLDPDGYFLRITD